MRTQVTKALSITSVLVGLLFVTFLGQVHAEDMWKQKPAPKGATFKIGHSMAMTGPVSDAAAGLTADKDYASWINENGGIHGVPVEILWADNKYHVPLALKTYRRWKDEGILIHNSTITASEIALKPSYARDKIVCIPASADPKLIDPPGWIFQPLTSYAEDFAGACTWFMNDWKKKGKTGKPRMVVLYPDNTFGRAYKAALKHVKKTGIDIVGEFVIPWSPIDTTATMTKVLEKRPDVVHLTLHAGGASVIFKDMIKTGVLPNIPVMTNRLTIQGTTLTLAPKEAEGVMATSPWGLPGEDLPGVKHMNEWYEKRHGKKDIINYDVYYNYSYGMMRIACEAIKRAYEKVGWPVTGQDIYDALGTMEDFDMGGFTAPVSFSGEGMQSRRGISKIRMIRIHDAKFEPVSDWFEVPLIRTDGTWVDP